MLQKNAKGLDRAQFEAGMEGNLPSRLEQISWKLQNEMEGARQL